MRSFPASLLVLSLWADIVSVSHADCLPKPTPLTSLIDKGALSGSKQLAVRLTLLEELGSSSCPFQVRLANGTLSLESEGFVIAKVQEVFQGDAFVGDELLLGQDTDTGTSRSLPNAIVEAGKDFDGFLAFVSPISCSDEENAASMNEGALFRVSECGLGSSVRPWINVTREEKEYLRGLPNLPENPLTFSPTVSPTVLPTGSPHSMSNANGKSMFVVALLAASVSL